MRANSLAFRLFLSATGFTVVILIISGIGSVVALPPGGRARLRPQARRLSAHPRRRRRLAGRQQRQIPAIGERAAIRIAAVGLVLAGHAPRCRKVRRARLALALGRRIAAVAGRIGREQYRHPARLCAGPGRSETAIDRAHHRSRRGREFSRFGRGRCRRNRRRNPRLRSRAANHLCDPGACPVADDDLPGSLRSRAAQTHFGGSRGGARRDRRAAGREFSGRDRAACHRDQCADRGQSRNRRTRAHACRKSRACAEDAALGDGERGGGARRRSARRENSGTDRHHARSGHAASRARASCRAR